MKRNLMFAVIIAAVVVLSGMLVVHAAPAGKFLGANKCKMCHSTDKKGNQLAKWKATPHANAFTTLTTAKAKEVGVKLGVTDPSTDPKCLKCHVTGYGQTTDSGFDPKMGVQCESCHGAGEAHMKARMASMKDTKPDVRSLVPAGEIVVKPDAKVCTTCHNSQSPTFKSFNYNEQIKKVGHPDPRPKAK